MSAQIPVLDLFAGPGGLGEGFSADSGGNPSPFRIALSVEMEPSAHATLTLRTFMRTFRAGRMPDEVYARLRGSISTAELAASHPREWAEAEREAWQATLGPDLDYREVRRRADAALQTSSRSGDLVLIGGPPCQAYSLVGRSRMRSTRGDEFDDDHRHVLYREYLKILADYQPLVFVMENVKGLLSASVRGAPIFERILRDLERPGRALDGYPVRYRNVEYTLHPVVQPDDGTRPSGPSAAADFVVRSELLGLPQARHRVIILGIRKDLGGLAPGLMLVPGRKATSVRDVIEDLPHLRSGSSRNDSPDLWLNVVKSALVDLRKDRSLGDLRHTLDSVEAGLALPDDDRGGAFVKQADGAEPSAYGPWYKRAQLDGVPNHHARGHMPADLARYLFCSVFAMAKCVSPRLADMPPRLLPDHANVQRALAGSMFSDRFRVQRWDQPATTITSHISKDGHYFIHPDPTQCRSLTVREAARLQTFPDDYFFEGPRTAQYVQVGNAVPPLLAQRIAGVVAALLGAGCTPPDAPS